MYEVGWKASELRKAKREARAGEGIMMVVGREKAVVERVARAMGETSVRQVVMSDGQDGGDSVNAGETVVSVLAVGRGTGKEALKLSVVLWKRVVAEREVRVVTVTQRAVQVEGRERVNPWARAVWALGRCVTAECKEVLGGHVMVDVEGRWSAEEVRRETEAVGGEKEEMGKEILRVSMASEPFDKLSKEFALLEKEVLWDRLALTIFQLIDRIIFEDHDSTFA